MSQRKTPVERALAFVKEHGVSLELRAGEILGRAHMFPLHNVHFADRGDGRTKVRHVDLVAERWVADDDRNIVSWPLAIECKYDRDPWIAYTGASHSGFPRVRLPVGSLGRDALIEAVNQIADDQEAAFFREPDVHAVSGLLVARERARARPMGEARDRPESSRPDLPAGEYTANAAMLQATSAALALAQRSDAQLLAGSNVLRLYQPVVVLDGDLFSCRLVVDEPVLEPIPLAYVETAHPDTAGDNVLVTVITIDHLQQYASDLVANALPFLQAITPTARRLRGSAGRPPTTPR
ncbi:MAG: hypothetical protein IT352_03950 [Gemmatimonadales bacterium]|nr:hypothetical protein [Gemmatimonadales bacterium]